MNKDAAAAGMALLSLSTVVFYMLRMGYPIYFPPSIVTKKEMKKKREMMFTK